MNSIDNIESSPAPGQRTIVVPGQLMMNFSGVDSIWNGNLAASFVSSVDLPANILLILQATFNSIGILLNVTGLLGNLACIIVFFRIGLEDSVSVSFFSLAITDFIFCIFDLARTITQVLQLMFNSLELQLYISPIFIYTYVNFLKRIFGQINNYITTFLAIQRCLCVLLPFKVKGMFTMYRNRTVILILVLASFSMFVGLSSIAMSAVRGVTNLKTNFTQLVVVMDAGDHLIFLDILDIETVVSRTACPAIVFVCVIIMGVALKKSVQFKNSATIASSSNSGKRKGHQDETEKKKRSKEMLAVLQVLLLCIIFVSSKIPIILFRMVASYIEEFALMKKYHNAVELSFYISAAGDLINSSVNFFIYYRFNSRFREAFLLFVKRKEVAKK